ncbi:MAG: amino acid synthesis family protein [Hyphomicrobiales bacterium]
MLEIRKIVDFREDVLIEGGKPADPPWVMCAVAGVVRNPWAGQGFVENLRSTILDVAPGLGDALVPRLLDLAGGGDRIEGYGKAAVVGVNGEVEHASGLIHTLRFGNRYREAVGGTTFLAFSNKRAGPGTAITIPMMHKHDEGYRSHYLTLEFHIVDAPAPDEIVIALGAALTGRPHHRIGNRYEDMKDMGVDQTGEALES